MVLLSLPCAAAASAMDRVITPLPQPMEAPVSDGPIERRPLALAWVLDPQQAVSVAAPAIDISRSWWQQVDGRTLQRGITMSMDAADAIIQITPAVNAHHPAPADLRLLAPSGHMVPLQAVTAPALQATGMPAREGTLMLRTGSRSAKGTYRLQVSQANGQYVVQVLEPHSPIALEVQASASAVLAGGSLQLAAGLLEEAGGVQHRVQAGTLQGHALLVAPDGRSWPQPMSRGPQGALQAKVALPAEGSRVQGLWELQVVVQGNGVVRDGKVNIAVAQPTARLQGPPAMQAGGRAVAVPFTVARQGRYEVRGTLFATAPDGSMKPVAQAHAAAWFEQPGDGSLVLPFEQVGLPEGYGRPFELRHLQLRDQAQIAPVDERVLAARF